MEQFKDLPVYRHYDTPKELRACLLESYYQKPKSLTVSSYLLSEMQSGRGKSSKHYNVELVKKVNEQIDSGLPIELAIIAIAHKNPQLSICGGRKRPDLSELGFLSHLYQVTQNIQTIYPPGARFTVLTEGELYHDYGIFDVEREEIEVYENSVRSIARDFAGGALDFISLQQIVERNDLDCMNLDAPYQHFIPAMEKSITKTQIRDGVTPEQMAYTYAQIHKAKHIGTQGSPIYSFLQKHLGNNYIYCSVTTSNRPEVLDIDPYPKPASLPQHGLGLLLGGGNRIKPTRFDELQNLTRTHDVRRIGLDEDLTFGFVLFGKKK